MTHATESIGSPLIETAPPQRWLVSCDESGVGGETHYGFGALWMKEQRRGDFVGEIQRLRNQHNYKYECKWQKANNYRYVGFFRDLIEFFFKKEWLAFNCIIVKKALVDKGFHGGDYDLARRKHFTGFLVNKIKECIRANTHSRNTFRIWVDPIASRYEKADEAVKIIAERILASRLGQQNSLEAVLSRDSKETPSIQLCDLLLGAVIQAWNKTSSSDIKSELQLYMADHLGWSNLASDTSPSERKFNIWYFHDKRIKERKIQTRTVRLKYPLRPRGMNIAR